MPYADSFGVCLVFTAAEDYNELIRTMRLGIRRCIAIIITLFVVAASPIWAQSDSSAGSGFWRDVLLTVPPAAKAGFLLTSIAVGLSGTNPAPEPYPPPYNYIAFGFLAGQVVTNIGLIASSWLDMPDAAQMWRRGVFVADALGIVLAGAFMVEDLMSSEPTNVLPYMAVIGSFGLMMLADLLPFSTELRAGIGFDL